MKKNYINHLNYLLAAAVLIVSGSFMPSIVFAEQRNVQICDQQNQYLKRRLASDQEDNLCEQYNDHVLLVVNTASRCAYTDQYDELEKLYAEYKNRGLVVIGFPSNDFGNQEPENEKKIKDFCRLTYGVQFPMYEKTRVKGVHADPFYKKLAEASGQIPQWNFHKYLIDRNGRLVGSYQSAITPYNKKIIMTIEKHL